MNEYSFEELAAAATKSDATQEEINALGEWFERYGMGYWNGTCWDVDGKNDLYLSPVYREVEADEFECVGYTFSSETQIITAPAGSAGLEEGEMRKSYKDFEKQFIGASDIAALVLVGYRAGEGAFPQMLNFGKDGAYSAYVVPSEAEIGGHYREVARFSHWMAIYDDDSFVKKFRANEIRVFRAGEMGCIIQLCGSTDE